MNSRGLGTGVSFSFSLSNSELVSQGHGIVGSLAAGGREIKEGRESSSGNPTAAELSMTLQRVCKYTIPDFFSFSPSNGDFFLVFGFRNSEFDV